MWWQRWRAGKRYAAYPHDPLQRVCPDGTRASLTRISSTNFALNFLPAPLVGAPSLSNRAGSRTALTGSATLFPASRQHRGNRAHQYLEIEQQAPVFYVFKIQLHTRFKGRIRARDDLPKPRYAGFYVQSSVMVGTVSHVIVYGMGARTNQAHIPFQHIPKLGQFVEAVLPKKVAERGDARIISDFKERVLALVELAQGISESIGSIAHGPEFITNKFLPLFSCAEGGMDDRARRLQLDGQGNRKQEWPEEQKCDGG